MTMLSYHWTRYLSMAFYIFIAVLSFVAISSSHSSPRAADQLFEKLKKHVTDDYIRSRRQCTHSARERRNADRMSHSVRSTGIRGDFGSALYFTGQSDYIRLSGMNHLPIDYPTDQLTVELWVKPEGGQRSPAIIIGFSEACHSNEKEIGWSLGINESDGHSDRNARFFFSLLTDRHRSASIVTSHQRYEPNTWVHLAATYNGTRMKLYVNGAVVDSSFEQSGPIFNAATQKCKQLVLGGSLQRQATFRGAIDELKIWHEARGHESVKDSMYNDRAMNSGHLGNIIHEDFDFIGEWEDIGDKAPFLVDSDIPRERHNLKLAVPPCGVTICDNPTLMKSYMERPMLQNRKVLRYRIVSIANDDGSEPTVTQDQITRIQQEINAAFAPYNISWEVTDMVVQNSSLRRRVVLHSCHLSDIGNEICNYHCQNPYTGNDGGDCKNETVCEDNKLGNGICEEECNKHYHEYDHGDCCDPDVTAINETCFDPNSPLRSYMTVEELKHIINAESNTHLNIFFVRFDDPSIEGFATMPWEIDALGVLGGSVMNTECCQEPGSADSIIHELGHNLGLWHVHEGISGLDCSDPCYERHASLELGDMIEDTKPTPENMECRDPLPCDNYATCGFEDEEFIDTPYRNYMSYADHECTNHFTPQQSARMHCYIDLFYSTWRSDNDTSNSISLPPHILSEQFSEHRSDNSVTLTWLPPLNDMAGEYGIRSGNFECGDCAEGNILAQYASSAEVYGTRVYVYRDHPPDRATGAPDASRCTLSRFSWMACSDCVLELRFSTPVVPDRLSVWANYQGGIRDGTKHGIKNIELLTTTGDTVSLGSTQIYCDMPYTTLLPEIQGQVDRVRIHTDQDVQNLSIDAVLLESRPRHAECNSCGHRSYSVRRDPAFENSEGSVDVREPYFVDRTVQPGVNYTYSVAAVVGDNEESEPSPPLQFRLGQPFCGNGVINSENSEECDDGNAMDGDGCNTECTVETHFKCTGEPSLCYMFLGDGICEDFERNISTEDCGYYTPPGYEDQWAIGAKANPNYQSWHCPESVVVGDPGPSQVCHKNVAYFDSRTIRNHVWYPCEYEEDRTDYWLKVQFQQAVVATAVIIHLGSDGLYRNQEPKRVSISLMGLDRINHTQAAKNVSVSCRDTPVHFNILHDLSKPFYYTREVYIEINSYEVSISAVRLRSWKAFDPVELTQCGHNHIYTPETNLCETRKPKCSKLKLKNATLHCTGLEGEKVAEGGQCEAMCNTGYTPKTTSVFQCIGGEWRGPNMKEVKCRSVDCGWPVIPYAKVICPHGTKFGRECTFKCQSPAKLQGTSNSVVCQEDGLFSLPNSFCQLTCNSLPDVQNADLQSNSCAQTLQHIVGTTCKYTCQNGYRVAGEFRDKRTMRYTCGADGTWDGPRCVPVVCAEPPTVFKGLYNCTDSFNFNSVCSLHCPDQQDNTENLITCGADRTWDRDFTMCASFVGAECLPPLSSVPDIIYTCGLTNEIGSTCNVSCMTGPFSRGQVVVDSGPNLIYASSMRQWQDAIVCTGLREWFPDPLKLRCVEPCNKSFYNDDMCDRVNNKAYCDWDKGRCCLSTCPECYGTIMPFPHNCTDECMCLDPNAAENI